MQSLTIAKLDDMNPGFAAYFKVSLQRQREMWEREKRVIDDATLDAYLAILACAHGPLAASEIKEVGRRIEGILISSAN